MEFYAYPLPFRSTAVSGQSRLLRLMVPLLLLLAIAAEATAQSSYRNQVPPAVTEWLDTKVYEGASREYQPGDKLISDAAIRGIESMGINWRTVLRNEMFARHGYIFKTPVLAAIFSTAKWYRPDPSVGTNALGAREIRNVNWLKNLEDKEDFERVSKWLSAQPDIAGSRLLTDADLDLTLDIELALNHLFVNPARLFRNVIFARRGLVFSDPVLKKIFESVHWYRPVSADQGLVTKRFSPAEWSNLELLRHREWIDVLDTVKISLPPDVISIPVVGYNALYIKTVQFEKDSYHFSWADAWTALEEKGKGLDGHETDTALLVDQVALEAIERESDPVKKLILFFNAKKYSGYADTLQFNKSDLVPPPYLDDAIKRLKLDWLMLLRKEIHARNGAIFIDPNIGPIFRACSWYKPRHNLTVRTVSRFPSGVAIKAQELRNYSLLEGEELHRRREGIIARLVNKNRASLDPSNIACDLQGNFYFVRTGTILIPGANTAQPDSLTVGYGYTSEQEYLKGNLTETIGKIMQNYEFYQENYEYLEETWGGLGC